MPWSIAHKELTALRRRRILGLIKLKIETIPDEEDFDALRDMVTEMRYETYSIESFIDLGTWKEDIFERVNIGVSEIKQKQLTERLLEAMIRTK